VSRVLVAMSGGVDSSLAAAALVDAGHEVTGVTLRQWRGPAGPGPGGQGCCGLDDTEDARRVAAQLGVPHYTFDVADEFRDRVVDPFVAAYGAGRTPNPCATCNRDLRWGWLYRRARAMGFDAVATGHHARVVAEPDGGVALCRGRDRGKDQSYVLALVPPAAWARTLLPVGELTKAQVRREAARRGLRTATKPESMEICFVGRGGLRRFLGARLPLRPGPVVDRAGAVVGTHAGAAGYTVGQRRGLGVAAGARRYVLDVDPAANTVVVGTRAELLTDRVVLGGPVWHAPHLAVGTEVEVQTRAHGPVTPGVVEAIVAGGPDAGAAPAGGPDGDAASAAGDALVVRLAEPRPRVAPGQVVALYDGDRLLAGGIAR